ncbi:MAG: protein translocase subunit SecD [Nitrospiria bacterium]
MRRGIKARGLLILSTVVISAVFFLPSTPIFSRMPDWWKKYLPHQGLNLGLDLQGGIHLVLEVEGEKAVQNVVDRAVLTLKGLLDEKKATYTALEKIAPLEIKVEYPSAESREAIKKLAVENLPALYVREAGENRLILAMREGEAQEQKDSAVSRALETIRNRVDQFGVAEPLIQRQGQSQILVQLPGIRDPQRAIALIGKTALLEFKLVADDQPLAAQLPSRIPSEGEEALMKRFEGQIPPEYEIVFEREQDKQTHQVSKRPYLVKKQALMSGDVLTDARVSIGDFNQAYVSITFDSTGARLFDRVTSENVKRRLAIILDNAVYSAPVIQERIPGGRAQITGSFTTQEANDLAIVLRAGALPAPVNIIQNVTVGPSLGRDSIEKGILAGIIGTLLVVGFMAVYYRLSGVLADFALVLNVVLLVGALAALNATLTLPGIAGIILAIGMAVDSNVLILERIREELRLGKPIRLAVDAGYEKAFVTIVDSHVTTLITALALFLFGTGPIKGFAVTLSLGVSINLFTSLVGTKVVYDVVNSRWKLNRLSI